MQPNKVGNFSHTQANVTAGKKMLTRTWMVPSHSSRELCKNGFIRRIPVFKHRCYQKRLKKWVIVVDLKEDLLTEVSCQCTQNIIVCQIFFCFFQCSNAQVILVLLPMYHFVKCRLDRVWDIEHQIPRQY